MLDRVIRKLKRSFVPVKGIFIFLFLLFTAISLLYNYTTDLESSSAAHGFDVLTKKGTFSEEVLILFWTEFFGLSHSQAWNLSQIRTTLPRCLENCKMTGDRHFLNTSDVVLFHSPDLSQTDLPPIHRPDQPWIWLQQESALLSRQDLPMFGNIFNWTMTYRRDSDIHHPYHELSPMNISRKNLFNRPSTQNLSKIASSKAKLVAWIVSNCHSFSRREEYVQHLQNYIPVDIFGKCGNLTCCGNRHRGHDCCYAQVGLKYKFYLSFENSLCVDYVTEKFFLALRYNMVPLVLGGANHKSIAPSNSFINVEDFNSTKELAEYLIFLDKTPEKYLEYFQWKLDYTVQIGDGWCSLCRKVKNYKRRLLDGSAERKVYRNLWKWWHHSPERRGHRVCRNVTQ